MMYTDESRFTEDEKMIVENLTRVACVVNKTDVEGVVGRSRLAVHSTVRKMVSYYIYHNVSVSGSSINNNVSLAAWYFNRDHGTICNSVKVAGDMYEVDKVFKAKYDKFIDCLNGAEYCDNDDDEVFIPEPRVYTWDEVRTISNFPYVKKIKLVPEYLMEKIVDMYKVGYSYRQISMKARTTDGFIKYIINKSDVERNRITVDHNRFKNI